MSRLGDVVKGQPDHDAVHNEERDILDYRIYVERYDTPQDAIDAAIGGTAAAGASTARSAVAELYFGPGVHEIDTPMLIRSVIDLTITLDPKARIRPTTSMDAVFDICGVNNFKLSGGKIQIPTGVVVQDVIHVYADNTKSAILTERPTIGPIKIECEGTGYFVKGLRGGENNTLKCDEFRVVGLDITGRFGFSEYGVHMQTAAGNGLNATIDGLKVYLCDYVAWVDRFDGCCFINPTGDGGDPGSGGGTAAFRVNAFGTNIVGPARMEAFKKLLISDGPLGAAYGCTFVGEIIYGAQEADAAAVIDWKAAGTLGLGNLRIFSPGVTPAITITPLGAAECELSGSVTIYADSGRPAAGSLVSGANAVGRITYHQATASGAWQSRDVIDLDA